MNAKRIFAWTALTVVALSTLWLLFSSYMLSDLLLFSDAQFVVAREGAEVALRSDGLYVLQGEAGMVGRAILPTLAVAVSALIFFAFAGCRSMLRHSSASSAA